MYFYIQNHKSPKVLTCEDLSKKISKKPDFDNKPEMKEWEALSHRTNIKTQPFKKSMGFSYRL